MTSNIRPGAKVLMRRRSTDRRRIPNDEEEESDDDFNENDMIMELLEKAPQTDFIGIKSLLDSLHRLT